MSQVFLVANNDHRTQRFKDTHPQKVEGPDQGDEHRVSHVQVQNHIGITCGM